jgi:hypothetical protein
VKRAIALLLPVLLAIACRTPTPGLPLAPDDPRPARLLESLYERASTRVSLRASAKLALDAPDLRFNRPQRLAVERPARLRVEVLGLFNQVAAVLVTDGQTYQLYEAGSGELEEGVVSHHLLWRVARVDLDPLEAVDLLLGAPMPMEGLRFGSVRQFEEGDIAFDRRDDRGVPRQRFRFDALGLLRRAERLDAEGQLVWLAEFDDYRELPGPRGEELFAHVVQLSFPRVDAKAQLNYKRVDLASELSDELFVLKLPERTAEKIPNAGSGAL